MSVTTASTAGWGACSPAPASQRCGDPPSGPARRGAVARRAAALFEIPFASAMRDRDAALLARLLDMDTHLHPKLHGGPASPGVVRLDFDSGLFLEHGPLADRWVLRARTWGRPTAKTVREWQLQAASAAHRLDRDVPSLPPPPLDSSCRRNGSLVIEDAGPCRTRH